MIRRSLVAFLLCLSCADGPRPEPTATVRASGAFGQFSICRLTKHAESVVEARIVGTGVPVARTANGFTETLVPVTVSVTRVLRGRDPGVVANASVLPQQMFLRDADGGFPGAVLFIAPIVAGGLGVHPCGGAFFDIGGGTLVNNGFYQAGISKQRFLAEVASSGPNVICPDEVGLAEQARPWDGGVAVRGVDGGMISGAAHGGLADGG